MPSFTDSKSRRSKSPTVHALSTLQPSTLRLFFHFVCHRELIRKGVLGRPPSGDQFLSHPAQSALRQGCNQVLQEEPSPVAPEPCVSPQIETRRRERHRVVSGRRPTEPVID